MSVRTRWYQKDMVVTLGNGERFRIRSHGRTIFEVEMTKTIDPDYLARMSGRGITHDIRGPGPHRDIRAVPADAPGTWSMVMRTLPYTLRDKTADIGNSGFYTDTKPTEAERAYEPGVDHDIRPSPRSDIRGETK